MSRAAGTGGALVLGRSIRIAILVLFFVSGATGLVYQGVWFRELQALFGVTTHALAVVVAAFMGGLAAGSWAFGRAADRSARPLRMYGLLELGVGVLAPLVAFGIAGIERLYVALHPHLAGSLVALSFVRLVLALLVLLAPTVLMGGTLPALTVLLRRDAARRDADAALHRDLGSLYGLNTLGAVAGTALVGFVLLGQLGLVRTTLLAAVANVGVGLFSLWLERRSPASVAAEIETSGSGRRAPEDRAAPEGLLVRWAILAFAVSGGLSLAYEVAWTRVLAQVIGSSTYAFSMILGGFLLGVGAGSLLLGRWKGRDEAGLWGFSAAELGIGATAALVVPLLVRLPELQLRGFAFVESMRGVLVLQFGLCLLVVLLPTLFMGATFPLVAGFVARRARDVGRDVGRLYAGNTVGGIVGSMLAGFVVLPALGTQKTLLLALGGNVLVAVVGFALLWRHERGRVAPPPGERRPLRLAFGGVALLFVVLAFVTPPWDPYVLDAGIAIGGPEAAHGDPNPSLRIVGRGSDILYYREGLNANISVRKDESQLYLKTNGKTDGTSKGDMPTQLMLGLLPSLAHPEPRRTLVIGLGTGASARAALVPGLARLDVVEIEPVVVEAARRYFGVVNDGLFDDPRTRIVVDDARSFLLTTPERYDIVVSEPSNPWISGVASLFSVDHYQRCADRLASGGLVAQWLQIYALRPELVQMVLASMHEVFPHLTVWSFHHGDLIVLASREPLPLFDRAAMDVRLDGWQVRDTVHRVLDVRSAAGVLGFFLLDEEDAARVASGAPLNTEDRPRLEFAAPLSLYLPTRDTNAEMLLAARRRVLPHLAPGQEWSRRDALELARAAYSARRFTDAESWVREALAEPALPRPEALTLGGETAFALREPELANTRLEEALRIEPRSAAARPLALVRLLQGRTAEAVSLIEVACAPQAARTPREIESCLQLLELMLQRGRADVVLAQAQALRGALQLSGDDPTLRSRILGMAARACVELRQPEEAANLAQQAFELNPQCTAAWRVFATLAFMEKRYPEAIEWWERCVEYRQIGPDILLPLAIAYQRTGRLEEARRHVARVLAADPKNASAQRLSRELGSG